MVRLLANTGWSTGYWGALCENVSEWSDVDEKEGLQESHIQSFGWPFRWELLSVVHVL